MVRMVRRMSRSLLRLVPLGHKEKVSAEVGYHGQEGLLRLALISQDTDEKEHFINDVNPFPHE